MSPARFSVSQVVLVNLLFLLFIVIGGVVAKLLPVDVYPDTSLDMAQITTPWLGASAEEVERLITKVIEDEIEDVRGLLRIVSHSLPNVSVINVKFREDLPPEEVQAALSDNTELLKRLEDMRLMIKDKNPDIANIIEGIEMIEVSDEIWQAARDQKK